MAEWTIGGVGCVFARRRWAYAANFPGIDQRMRTTCLRVVFDLVFFFWCRLVGLNVEIGKPSSQRRAWTSEDNDGCQPMPGSGFSLWVEARNSFFGGLESLSSIAPAMPFRL